MLCLSEEIDDKSLDTLMNLGLRNRFPNEFATWERRREEIKQRFQGIRAERQKEMHTMLERNLEDIRVKLREAVIIEVLKAFPWVLVCSGHSPSLFVAVVIDNRSVRREAVLPKSRSVETSKLKADPEDATRKTYLFFMFLC